MYVLESIKYSWYMAMNARDTTQELISQEDHAKYVWPSIVLIALIRLSAHMIDSGLPSTIALLVFVLALPLSWIILRISVWVVYGCLRLVGMSLRPEQVDKATTAGAVWAVTDAFFQLLVNIFGLLGASRNPLVIFCIFFLILLRIVLFCKSFVVLATAFQTEVWRVVCDFLVVSIMVALGALILRA